MTQIAGASLTDVYGVLKEYYSSSPVINELERKHPFYALVPKDTAFEGEYFVQPVWYGTTTASADFATAQTNSQNPNLYGKFLVPITTNYGLATVSNAARLASRTTRGAFVDTLKEAINGAMDAVLRADAAMLYRSGDGAIGVIATGGITSGTITLTNPTDAVFFQAGQYLGAVDANGVVRTAGYVIATDVSAGKIVVSATKGGSQGNPGSWAAGDSLYPVGNLNTSIAGLGTWIPYAAAKRATLGTPMITFGVDVSVDPTRLQGTRMDMSGTDIESALIELLSQVRLLGGSPDHVFMNPVSYRALSKALQARSQYTKTSFTNDAGLTFSGIEVDNAIVLEDSDCPAKVAYAIDLSTFKLASYGRSPGLLDYGDGLPALRTSNFDSVEARVGGYRQLVCSAPVKNGVAILSQ